MPLELDNRTQYRCEALPMTDVNGATILRIVLKAGFVVDARGELSVEDSQPEIVMEDRPWGEPGKSCIRYESDIVLHKPLTDLVVNGQAHAPGGRPARHVDVGLAYGDRVLKRIRVSGDRVWVQGAVGWTPTTPAAFETMPIVFDRAYGGQDDKGSEPRNRTGTGYASSLSRAFGGTRVPNVELVSELIVDPRDKPQPAGMGFVSRDWEPRLLYAGTYDQNWLDQRFPLLPRDFKPLFNQGAPQDQWVQRPKTGDVIRVSGMTPTGHFEVKLPDPTMPLTLRYRNKTVSETMALDTILVEPDHGRLVLTWRGTADIHGDPFRLEEMIVGQPPPPKPVGCC